MDMDHIQIANRKSLKDFEKDYFPPSDEWKTWIHPKSTVSFNITLQNAQSVAATDFEACFQLIEQSSLEDYKRSKNGWKPKEKKREMRLLDLKYILVKHDDQIQGFCSFMPTTEDECSVVYCYEIHLAHLVQGTGLGKTLMGLLDAVGSKTPNVNKIMLTCFTSNHRAHKFYRKLGFETDEYSPPPRMLRNGTRIDSDYVILSKRVPR